MTPRKTWLLWSAAVAVALFALMWIGYVLQWNWLTTIDSSALDALYRYGVAHPAWVTSWDVFCTVLGPTAFRLLTLVVIVVALVRRNLRVALFLVISVELSGLVTEIAKQSYWQATVEEDWAPAEPAALKPAEAPALPPGVVFFVEEPALGH